MEYDLDLVKCMQYVYLGILLQTKCALTCVIRDSPKEDNFFNLMPFHYFTIDKYILI